MGTGMTIGGIIGTILIIVLKGLFGTDKVIKETSREMRGKPLGPRLSAKLRQLGNRQKIKHDKDVRE